MLASLLARRRVIAVNNAWRQLPKADILWFCDQKWWGWYGKEVIAGFQGDVVATNSTNTLLLNNEGKGWVKALDTDRNIWLSSRPTILAHGTNSGYQAINLAFLKGVSKIVLLGFDMNTVGGTHWHEVHPGQDPVAFDLHLTEVMLPQFTYLAYALTFNAVEVINANPKSSIECWQKMTLEEVLASE